MLQIQHGPPVVPPCARGDNWGVKNYWQTTSNTSAAIRIPNISDPLIKDLQLRILYT
jgi:hypothetical protein